MSTFWSRILFFAAPALVACGSSGGDKPSDSNEWSGHTYKLSIGDRSWTDPRGVINDIKDYVPEFWFEVKGTSSKSFDVVTATARDGTQDVCNPTATLPGADNAIGPADFPLRIKHAKEDIVVHATLHDLTFDNVLPSGGAVSTTGTFSATLDGRDVAPLFTLIDSDPTPDELCTALSQVSPPAPCEVCAYDGQTYCLTLKASKVGAEEATSTITPIETPSDSSCN